MSSAKGWFAQGTPYGEAISLIGQACSTVASLPEGVIATMKEEEGVPVSKEREEEQGELFQFVVVVAIGVPSYVVWNS